MASSIGVSVRINGDIYCSKVATDQDAARLEVISSIRYDDLLQRCVQNTLLSYDDSIDPSPFYMLSYHRDRMLVAVDQLGWTEARSFLEGSLGVVRLKQVLQEHLTESYNSTQLPQPLKVPFTPFVICQARSLNQVLDPRHYHSKGSYLCHLNFITRPSPINALFLTFSTNIITVATID